MALSTRSYIGRRRMKHEAWMQVANRQSITPLLHPLSVILLHCTVKRNNLPPCFSLLILLWLLISFCYLVFASWKKKGLNEQQKKCSPRRCNIPAVFISTHSFPFLPFPHRSSSATTPLRPTPYHHQKQCLPTLSITAAAALAHPLRPNPQRYSSQQSCCYSA